jgi:hypothetical protein
VAPDTGLAVRGGESQVLGIMTGFISDASQFVEYTPPPWLVARLLWASLKRASVDTSSSTTSTI